MANGRQPLVRSVAILHNVLDRRLFQRVNRRVFGVFRQRPNERGRKIPSAAASARNLFHCMKDDMTNHEWVTGHSAWGAFVHEHPELGYQSGKWPFHNFLRRFRETLIAMDAIRLAKGRFWIAHLSRFKQAAFECATGHAACITGEAIVAYASSSAMPLSLGHNGSKEGEH
jgi:hypothetical protein